MTQEVAILATLPPSPATCLERRQGPGGCAGNQGRGPHDPKRTNSPSHASPVETGLSLTNVPFVLSRSVTDSRPDGSTSTRAWAREMDGSGTLTPTPDPRPTTAGPVSSGYRVPRPGPSG